jgi:hypothetical protein
MKRLHFKRAGALIRCNTQNRNNASAVKASGKSVAYVSFQSNAPFIIEVSIEKQCWKKAYYSQADLQPNLCREERFYVHVDPSKIVPMNLITLFRLEISRFFQSVFPQTFLQDQC